MLFLLIVCAVVGFATAAPHIKRPPPHLCDAQTRHEVARCHQDKSRMMEILQTRPIDIVSYIMAVRPTQFNDYCDEYFAYLGCIYKASPNISCNTYNEQVLQSIFGFVCDGVTFERITNHQPCLSTIFGSEIWKFCHEDEIHDLGRAAHYNFHRACELPDKLIRKCILVWSVSCGRPALNLVFEYLTRLVEGAFGHPCDPIQQYVPPPFISRSAPLPITPTDAEAEAPLPNGAEVGQFFPNGQVPKPVTNPGAIGKFIPHGLTGLPEGAAEQAVPDDLITGTFVPHGETGPKEGDGSAGSADRVAPLGSFLTPEESLPAEVEVDEDIPPEYLDFIPVQSRVFHTGDNAAANTGGAPSGDTGSFQLQPEGSAGSQPGSNDFDSPQIPFETFEQTGENGQAAAENPEPGNGNGDSFSIDADQASIVNGGAEEARVDEADAAGSQRILGESVSGDGVNVENNGEGKVEGGDINVVTSPLSSTIPPVTTDPFWWVNVDIIEEQLEPETKLETETETDTENEAVVEPNLPNEIETEIEAEESLSDIDAEIDALLEAEEAARNETRTKNIRNRPVETLSAEEGVDGLAMENKELNSIGEVVANTEATVTPLKTFTPVNVVTEGTTDSTETETAFETEITETTELWDFSPEPEPEVDAEEASEIEAEIAETEIDAVPINPEVEAPAQIGNVSVPEPEPEIDYEIEPQSELEPDNAGEKLEEINSEPETGAQAEPEPEPEQSPKGKGKNGKGKHGKGKRRGKGKRGKGTSLTSAKPEPETNDDEPHPGPKLESGSEPEPQPSGSNPEAEFPINQNFEGESLPVVEPGESAGGEPSPVLDSEPQVAKPEPEPVKSELETEPATEPEVSAEHANSHSKSDAAKLLANSTSEIKDLLSAGNKTSALYATVEYVPIPEEAAWFHAVQNGTIINDFGDSAVEPEPEPREDTQAGNLEPEPETETEPKTGGEKPEPEPKTGSEERLPEPESEVEQPEPEPGKTSEETENESQPEPNPEPEISTSFEEEPEERASPDLPPFTADCPGQLIFNHIQEMPDKIGSHDIRSVASTKECAESCYKDPFCASAVYRQGKDGERMCYLAGKGPSTCSGSPQKLESDDNDVYITCILCVPSS